MTPEEAEAIYHDARRKFYEQAADYREPVVQRECILKGWQAVIDALYRETGIVKRET